MLLGEPPRHDGGEQGPHAVDADHRAGGAAGPVVRHEDLEELLLPGAVGLRVHRVPAVAGELLRGPARRVHPPSRLGRPRHARLQPAALVQHPHVHEPRAVLQEIVHAELELATVEPGLVRTELAELLDVARQAEADVLLHPQDVADRRAALVVELLPVEHPQEPEQGEHEQGGRRAGGVPPPAVGGGGVRGGRGVGRGGLHRRSGSKLVAS